MAYFLRALLASLLLVACGGTNASLGSNNSNNGNGNGNGNGDDGDNDRSLDPDASTPQASPSDGLSDIAALDSGRIQGIREDKAIVFRGIPYAAPPVGANRWREPQPVSPWGGTRITREFGSACIQTAPDTGSATGGSEDCLTLNVWKPASSSSASLPVMVFVHGGYNLRGSSNYELEPGSFAYDGHELVTRDVVLVTINYRIGALGWMAHPAFKAENAHNSAGNYGTLDQIAALQWVQRNIHAFGGDPARVLLFGQSAGATNTCSLIASPLAAGLFSRAIMHSGTCGMPRDGAVAQASRTAAEKLGCEKTSSPSTTTPSEIAACLRAKSATEISNATTIDFTSGGFTWGHNVDGWVFPANMGQLISSGRHNHVPLIVSVTAHEMTTLWRSAYPSIPIPTTAAEHEAALRKIYAPAIADRVVAEYPVASYPSPALASVAALSDASFVCPARAIARGVARAQTQPVRRMYFAHVLDQGPMRSFGAGHGLDLLFVFTPKDVSWFTPTPSEVAISNSLIDCFTRFAATGDPNTGGGGNSATAWPAYDIANDSHLVVDNPIRIEQNLRTKPCDFWASL